MKTNKLSTEDKIYNAIVTLERKGFITITYAAIARIVKLDPSTVKYHIVKMAKRKVVKRNAKTGHIDRLI